MNTLLLIAIPVPLAVLGGLVGAVCLWSAGVGLAQWAGRRIAVAG